MTMSMPRNSNGSPKSMLYAGGSGHANDIRKNYELVEAKKLDLVKEMCEIGEVSGFPAEAMVESVAAPYGIHNFTIMRK